MLPFKINIRRFRNTGAIEMEGTKQNLPPIALRVLATELEKLADDIENHSYQDTKYIQFTLKGNDNG